MLLGQLQSLLGNIYSVASDYDIYDFLVTDPSVAQSLTGVPCESEETLLIHESGEEVAVSLYLCEQLLGRLAERDPTIALDTDNLPDFLTALEGVSHFMYYAWNAVKQRPVTLMELELQAEVDKFVSTAYLMESQIGQLPRRLHRWLFDLPNLADHLSDAERERYRDANRYAGKYCLSLLRKLKQGESAHTLRSELRSFYRLSRGEKIQRIENI